MIFFNGNIQGEKIEDAMKSSAAAQSALAEGDTQLAGEQYKRSGELFEEQLQNLAKPTGANFNLVRFLAATSYYKGGHYDRAHRLCKLIHEFMLPTEVKPLWPQFRADVKSRVERDYTTGVRNKISLLGQLGEYEKVLEVLQQHPFVYDRASMAFLRAICCERLKDYRTAALFWADALKWNSQVPFWLFLSGSFPLYLAHEHSDVSEAWNYVECLLELAPNAMTYLAAASIRFHQGLETESAGEKDRLFRDQLRYFEKGWDLFQTLPREHQAHVDLRETMTLAFYAATSTYQKMDKTIEALALSNQAITFDPMSPLPWTARGLLTYPRPEALQDFRAAIERDDDTAIPYFHLAEDAIGRGNVDVAISFCDKALQRHPGKLLKATLLEWREYCSKAQRNGESLGGIASPDRTELREFMLDDLGERESRMVKRGEKYNFAMATS